MATNFLKYILIGIIASVPIGPVSVLIIRRTINKSRFHGYFSGAGAALSDSIYAVLAGLGLNLFMSILNENEKIIRFGGASIIILLGVYIAFSKYKIHEDESIFKRKSYIQDYFSTFLLTATNPFIIFIYLGLYAGFGIDSQMHGWNLIWQFFSIYLGCNLWWLTLTYLVFGSKKRLKKRLLEQFNIITGIVMVLLSFVSIISFLLK